MAEHTLARPADRYGRGTGGPRSSIRWPAVLTALVIALGVLIAVIGYQKLGVSDVRGDLAAYRLIDDQTAEVTISVTRTDADRPAVCIVRARSKDGSETGRREILVGPARESTVQVKALVKTSKPPVAGDVYGCGNDIPSYLTG